MPKSHSLLIVEDHRQLAENLFEFLGDDYILDYAADGLSALHLLATNRYDIAILDVMLPGVNGVDICRRIRDDLQSEIGIIMLTAKDSIDDKSRAYGYGADDYLVKPFNMHELQLRIEALLRRQNRNQDCISAGPMRYFPGTLEVRLDNGQHCSLSGYGATIFETLIRNTPNYVGYDKLSQALWGTNDGDSNTLRTHVYSLRKRLKAELGHDYIATSHGRGYSLDLRTPPH